MRTKTWKAFWNHEKEEQWLNDKVADGLAMIDYHTFRYTWEECVPDEYIYRIELLEHGASHPESARYIHFLEESGIEHIATYNSWIYLRKRASSGSFDLYNDLDSRIKHYQRIAKLWLTLALCEFCISFGQIGLFASSVTNGNWYWIASVVFMTLILAVCALFLGLWHSYGKKIKHLQCEREIQE